MDSNHPSMADLAWTATQDEKYRRKALDARVERLETLMSDIVDWVADAVRHINELTAEVEQLKKRKEKADG